MRENGMRNDDVYEAIGEIFFEEVMSDEESFDKKGYNLKALYESVDRSQQEIIDDVLITLCGWSYPTIVEKALKRVEENKKRSA